MKIGDFVDRTYQRMSGDHAKPGWKRCDFGGVALAEIVNCHARSGDFLKRAIGVLVVEGGSPVSGFVSLNLTRSAVGGLE